MSDLFGSIEGGGTKFVCTVAAGPNDIKDEIRYPTTTPDETLARAIAFFQEQQAKHGKLAALGIGSFGPIDVDRGSPTWGYVTGTPKPHWSHTDVVGRIRKHFDVPIAWDTDVNAAAFGEHKWGAARGLDTFIYLTIGTGIGGGGMIGGKLMHGLVHPEMGHIALPHDREADPFSGICPYHGDCLEGMASGTAVGKRWNAASRDLPPDHEAWVLEADYLALGLRTFVVTLSPQRIIMGGGVMKVAGLFPRVRARLQKALNGYVEHEAILENIDDYVVWPELGDQAGMLGGIALAQAELG